jgi:hypothetical protein
MPNRESIKVTPTEMALILLAHELNGFTSAEFIQYDSVTEPKLNKKSRTTGLPCPFTVVKKFTSARCALKVIYENAMNNAQARAGEDRDFEAKELPWGEWITFEDGKRSKILIKHKGAFYIRTTYTNPNEIPEVKYVADGKSVKKSELADYLPPEKESTGEAKDKVIVRTYNINSMLEIRMAGKTYSIEQE